MERALTASDKDLVCPVLVSQLGGIALPRFLWVVRRRHGSMKGMGVDKCRSWAAGKTHKLDSNLLVVQQVGALENDAKRALADLLADAVVHADDVRRGRSHGERAGARGRTPQLKKWRS